MNHLVIYEFHGKSYLSLKTGYHRNKCKQSHSRFECIKMSITTFWRISKQLLIIWAENVKFPKFLGYFVEPIGFVLQKKKNWLRKIETPLIVLIMPPMFWVWCLMIICNREKKAQIPFINQCFASTHLTGH